MIARTARRLATILAALIAIPAAAADLVIGQIAPFSGPLAPTGIHLRAGAQLYFDRVNAGGGVHGAKVQLVTRDDAYKVTETVKLTRELLKEHTPIALFGLVGTGNVTALVAEKILDAAEIPAVGIRTGANSLIYPAHPYLFIGRASYATEVEAMVRHLGSTGSRRIAVFYQDDAFGADGLVAAERAIAKGGLELTTKAGYKKNTTEVEPAVATILAATPQSVIMIANTAAAAAFVKQFREAGGGAILMALSTTDGPQIADIIGMDAARGLSIAQVVPDPNNRALAIVREIQQAFRDAAPKEVKLNHTLIQGYIGAKLLVEGLRPATRAPTTWTSPS